MNDSERNLVADALKVLGKQNLVLGIQDVSFPGADEEDVGRGSPYSRGAQDFFQLAAELGFTGIQFGPQGLVSEGSDSPYEGTLFSRNVLNLDLADLAERGLLSHATRDALFADRPVHGLRRVAHRHVWGAVQRVLDEAQRSVQRRPSLVKGLGQYRADNWAWLLTDALYDALCAEHGQGYYPYWSGPRAQQDQRLFSRESLGTSAQAQRIGELCDRHAVLIDRYVLGQFLVAEQHQALRRRLNALGLRTFGDLQVGMSARDEWARQALTLEGYRMGAPPSRTNPEGQPWGYRVLDPSQFGTTETPGLVVDFFKQRIERLLGDVDGVRIDHPHGLVCPWVYRDDDPHPLQAVKGGARLTCAPDLPDHPHLARFAIPSPEQLNPDRPRYADDRVKWLTEAQVDRYGVLLGSVVSALRARGLGPDRVACEVLSTLPYPLERVLQRYGLGRFRVLQKANLRDPADVYRSENAAPVDWVMLGNHDTRPLWGVIASWQKEARFAEQADYLAAKLEPEAAQRPAFAEQLKGQPGAMAQAMLADAFACPAQNLYLFFVDLFGMHETYNAPGTVGPENWSLRVPPDYATSYRRARAAGGALNLPRALARALRARRQGGAELIAALEAR